jgi:hypothetical protein
MKIAPAPLSQDARDLEGAADNVDENLLETAAAAPAFGAKRAHSWLGESNLLYQMPTKRCSDCCDFAWSRMLWTAGDFP